MDMQTNCQDIQEIIDAALTPLYARTGFMQGVQANHGWSTNTGGIAVATGATGLDSVTLPAVPKSGKLRIIGNITFTSSAAATQRADAPHQHHGRIWRWPTCTWGPALRSSAAPRRQRKWWRTSFRPAWPPRLPDVFRDRHRHPTGHSRRADRHQRGYGQPPPGWCKEIFLSQEESAHLRELRGSLQFVGKAATRLAVGHVGGRITRYPAPFSCPPLAKRDPCRSGTAGRGCRRP